MGRYPELKMSGSQNRKCIKSDSANKDVAEICKDCSSDTAHVIDKREAELKTVETNEKIRFVFFKLKF